MVAAERSKRPGRASKRAATARVTQARRLEHEPPYAERAITFAEEKRRIGQAAAMVRPGETIILDAGTTTHEVGLALAASSHASLTVVTNALPTAAALMETPGIEVIVVGGHAQGRRRATLGPLAVEFLQSFHADRAFLGVSGVDADAGFTAADFDAVQVKRAIIAHAAEVVAVTDSSKIAQVAFARIGPLRDASLLLTDRSVSSDAERTLAEAGLPVQRV